MLHNALLLVCFKSSSGADSVCRDTGDPKEGHLSVLPHHHPEYNKYYLETTHAADFKPPYHYEPAPVSCMQEGNTMGKSIRGVTNVCFTQYSTSVCFTQYSTSVCFTQYFTSVCLLYAVFWVTSAWFIQHFVLPVFVCFMQYFGLQVLDLPSILCYQCLSALCSILGCKCLIYPAFCVTSVCFTQYFVLPVFVLPNICVTSVCLLYPVFGVTSVCFTKYFV